MTVQVSVDGDAETHNRFRVMKSGRPTMHAIKPNIDEFSRGGGDFNLRAVLTRQNRDPEKVVTGPRSHGASRVSFEVVATDSAEAQFTDDDWNDFNKKYSTFLDHPYTSWAELPDDMQSMITRICERQQCLDGCGAGVSEVTVAPDGRIVRIQRIDPTPYSKMRRTEVQQSLRVHCSTDG